MSKLRILRLFGNPLEFLPEIIPCTNLRHLSLANVRIEGDQTLSTIMVDIEVRFNLQLGLRAWRFWVIFSKLQAVRFTIESW